MAETDFSGGQINDSRRLGPTVALAVVLAAAIFMLLLPISLALVPPVELPPPFPDHNQTSETLLYFAGFFVLLPVSVWVAWFAGIRISGTVGNDAFSGLVATLAAFAGPVILMSKVTGETWPFATVWLLGAAAGIWIAFRSAATSDTFARHRDLLWQTTVLSLLAAICVFVDWSEVDRSALTVGLLVTAAVLLVYRRLSPRELGRWGVPFDFAVVGLLLLAIPDLVIVRPEEAVNDPVINFDTETIQFHQNLFLGAASQVLGGSVLLVDTVSQYGIGSIYLIAAFFEIVPIGHGTLGLLDGFLQACVFAGGYGVLRMAGVNRLLSAASLAVAVIALVWGLYYPIGGLLQHGAIRFGLPMLLIIPTVAAVRWPPTSKIMGLFGLMVVGLSSIWALEAFIYVTFTFCGLIAIGLVWQPTGKRIRWVLQQILAGAAAIVITQVVFALLTLAASGSLPDWGLYFTYLREFLGGDIGDLTYDFDPWSPALAVAAIYIASAAAIAVTALLRRDILNERRAAFTALAGFTAYGIVLFSYFDNRSLEHILNYVSLPALLVATLWLALLLDPKTSVSRRVRTRALGLALLLGALMIANVWPAALNRAKDSFIGTALPGGRPLEGSLKRLWNLPPVVPGSDLGVSLIEQYMPDQDQTPVLVRPDLDVDILTRAQRANALKITDAKEASWVPGPHLPEVEKAIATFEPGERMLVDGKSLLAFREFEADPVADPQAVADEVGLVWIQTKALSLIAERFRLEKVAGGTGPDKLTVVELKAR